MWTWQAAPILGGADSYCGEEAEGFPCVRSTRRAGRQNPASTSKPPVAV